MHAYIHTHTHIYLNTPREGMTQIHIQKTTTTATELYSRSMFDLLMCAHSPARVASHEFLFDTSHHRCSCFSLPLFSAFPAWVMYSVPHLDCAYTHTHECAYTTWDTPSSCSSLQCLFGLLSRACSCSTHRWSQALLKLFLSLALHVCHVHGE